MFPKTSPPLCAAIAFAADVRLVTDNAVAYSPDPDNECHRAARLVQNEFERQFVAARLATDGGAAAAAAQDALKLGAPSTRKRKGAPGTEEE